MNEELYIYILPIGNIGNRFLEALRLELEFQLDLPCRLMKTMPSPEYAFNPRRSQYQSLEILKQVLSLSPEDAIKTLGLCDVDLYIPIKDFVFGQAQFNGLASMVSMKRLNAEFHSGPGGQALTFQRTLKEAIHELGHAFGLLHCDLSRCVMSQSSGVEQVDHKNMYFCDQCRDVIDHNIKRWKKPCQAKFYQREGYWCWTTRRLCGNLSRDGFWKTAWKWLQPRTAPRPFRSWQIKPST